MHPIEAPILQPGCPWSQFAAGTIRFCEEPICAWITQPANTWSNLAYLFVGLYLIQKSKTYDIHNPLKWFGPIAILVAIGSWLFHMSSTFFGEYLDLSAMFLFSGLLLALNMRRVRWIPYEKPLPAAIGIIGGSLLVLTIQKPLGIFIFICHMFLIVGSEFFLYRRAKQLGQTINYKGFRDTLIFLLSASLLWNLDLQRIVCDPNNHWLQLHAAWHILNSFCFITLWKFHAQFEKF